MDEHCATIEYYYPQYEVVVRPHGTRRAYKVLRPVFPGYVFMRVDSEGMCRVARLPVKGYWVKFGGEIESVPDRVIQRLKEFEGRNELIKEVCNVNPYRAGVRVYVHMDYADIRGIVVRLAGVHRAVVELPVGRAMVPVHCLEVA